MCFQNGLKTIGGSIAFEMWGMPMLAPLPALLCFLATPPPRRGVVVGLFTWVLPLSSPCGVVVGLGFFTPPPRGVVW